MSADTLTDAELTHDEASLMRAIDANRIGLSWTLDPSVRSGGHCWLIPGASARRARALVSVLDRGLAQSLPSNQSADGRRRVELTDEGREALARATPSPPPTTKHPHPPQSQKGTP